MKTKYIFLILIIITIIVISIILGSKISEKYYFLFIIALPYGYLLVKKHIELNNARLVSILRKKWGVSEARSRNFSEINMHFKKIKNTHDNKYILDDRTWSDLDMNLVYAQIDRTITIPGEHVLYSILRQPLFSKCELSERDRIINLYLQNQNIREKHQIILTKLEKEGGRYLADMLWGDRPSTNKYAFLYRFIIILIPFFILIGLFNYHLAWFGLIAIFFSNMIIHYRTKRKISDYFPTVRYLGKLVKCANKLADIKHPVLEKYLKMTKECINKVSPIANKINFLTWEGNNVIYDYINILFLIEVRNINSVLSLINRYENQLKKIFDSVGFIDSMIAIASYRAGLKSFVKPKFTNSGPLMIIEDAVHPLVNEAIPNSISLEHGGVLITGSNMSGKTTFLKTIGINTVLAQTINTCLARKYQSCFFNTLTLIGRKDNIIEGRSYYLDEIIGLRRIIDGLNKEVPCLCLLDEVFRATNSLERISASAEILLYLVKKNCCIFATTHDLELVELQGNRYYNYHFQEEISEDDLFFNYKLHKGPSTTRNAIKLLRHVGYPEEITDAADLRIQEKEKNK